MSEKAGLNSLKLLTAPEGLESLRLCLYSAQNALYKGSGTRKTETGGWRAPGLKPEELEPCAALC